MSINTLIDYDFVNKSANPVAWLHIQGGYLESRVIQPSKLSRNCSNVLYDCSRYY